MCQEAQRDVRRGGGLEQNAQGLGKFANDHLGPEAGRKDLVRAVADTGGLTWAQLLCI